MSAVRNGAYANFSLSRHCGRHSSRNSMESIGWSLAGFLDDLDDFSWVRQERDVARLDLGGLGVHALRQESLEIGVDGAIFLSDDVPGRNGLPRHVRHFRIEYR